MPNKFVFHIDHSRLYSVRAKKRFVLLFFTTFILGGGCAVRPPSSQTTVGPLLQIEIKEVRSTFGNCTIPPLTCPSSDYPNHTMCSSQKLPTTATLHGWGTTPCLARKNLLEKACSLFSSIDPLGNISCIPDPSQGECPPIEIKCQKQGPPTFCTAHGYNGETIPQWLRPKAWGTSECEARHRLTQIACQENLRPSLLSQMTCSQKHTKKTAHAPLPTQNHLTDGSPKHSKAKDPVHGKSTDP